MPGENHENHQPSRTIIIRLRDVNTVQAKIREISQALNDLSADDRKRPILEAKKLVFCLLLSSSINTDRLADMITRAVPGLSMADFWKIILEIHELANSPFPSMRK